MKLKQLEELYAAAGLGKLNFIVRNHSSWMALKSHPNSSVVDKNIPGIDYAPKSLKEHFEDSVQKNKELLEKLSDEPAAE